MSAPKNSSSLSHAAHNEDVCRCLTREAYWDWVVTTAFYSALHYARYEIFPFKEGVTGYADFDDYCSKNKILGTKQAPHGLLIKLVKRHMKPAYAPYKRLYEAADNARYNNYQVSESLAMSIMGDLDTVKASCHLPITPT